VKKLNILSVNWKGGDLAYAWLDPAERKIVPRAA